MKVYLFILVGAAVMEGVFWRVFWRVFMEGVFVGTMHACATVGPVGTDLRGEF
jgi:hypothetical protein